MIDDFTLGPLAACSAGTDPKTVAPNSCVTFPTLATDALDARDPGHADIVATKMYGDGSQPGPIDVTGDASPPPAASRTIDSFVYVYVFALADGSVRATGVECPESGTSCKGIESYPKATVSQAPK